MTFGQMLARQASRLGVACMRGGRALQQVVGDGQPQ
jgi:hypothetical protein